MNLPEAFLVGFALAVDAMVVAFAYGLAIRERRGNASLKLAGTTALFQFAMPIAGFALTSFVYDYIEIWAPWIACAVFCALGGNVIFNALRDNCRCKKTDASLALKTLLAIGFATAIDALVVGAGIRCANASATNILVPASVIGATTFACVIATFHATKLFRAFPQKPAEIAAGTILIILGIAAVVI